MSPKPRYDTPGFDGGVSPYGAMLESCEAVPARDPRWIQKPRIDIDIPLGRVELTAILFDQRTGERLHYRDAILEVEPEFRPRQAAKEELRDRFTYWLSGTRLFERDFPKDAFGPSVTVEKMI